jgi:4-amino-4-deoxy-L-arabinose transferase-like glycosyltransferase
LRARCEQERIRAPPPSRPDVGNGSTAIIDEAREPTRPSRAFLVRVGLVALAGLALRVVYAAVTRDDLLYGDGTYYFLAGRLLADGEGFINPRLFEIQHVRVETANHVPGWIFAMALPTLVGIRDLFVHQLEACLVGTATIVTMAFAGRRLVGDRGGLIAAAIAAAYPFFWTYERQLLSETLVLLGAAIVVLLALRFLARPSAGRIAAVGAASGALALAHPEQLLLLVLLLVPLCIVVKRGWRTRMTWAVLGMVVGSVVVAPWVLYNESRFDERVVLTTGFGLTLRFGNCGATYHGARLGYKTGVCNNRDPKVQGDASTVDKENRKRALRYVRANKGRVPVVVLARVGRTFAVFRPFQQMRFEPTARLGVLRVAYVSYWVLMPFALAGAVLLVRRRDPALIPMLALVATVVIGAAVSFGLVRFRAPAEVPIVLLAAVAVDAIVARFRSRVPASAV